MSFLRTGFAPALASAASCAVALIAGAAALDAAARPAAPGRGAADGPGASAQRFAGPFEARVTRVVDGDTFEARIAIWFGQEATTLVRLRGVDAPERAGACASERDRAETARAALADTLSAGRVVLTHAARDKYFGRIVADVTVEARDGAFPPVDAAALLRESGLARPYAGRTRGGWCQAAH